MSDETTTTTPDDAGLDAPAAEEASPEIVADPSSHEPATKASPEDLPTSGELDAAPFDAVVQETTEGANEPAAVSAATPDAAAEPVVEDDLDDLLGMAGAETEPANPAEAEAAADAAEADAAEAAAPADDDEGDAPAEPVRIRRPRTVEEVRDKKELMRLPGQWFVVHTYAGYEQRVKDNLTSRVESLGADDRVHEVVIPTNEVTEFKKGKKQVVQKKFLPGYVLVRMEMDDELWGLVRHTPAVTGFVGGPGNKPVPLSIREVAETLKIPDEVIEEPEETEELTGAAEKKQAAADIDLEVGETIRVTTGPFADFTGTIAEINVDQAKLRVMVSVFGRETPLELPFDQVAKL